MVDLDRITTAPDILGGKACVRGMRISVALIVNLAANGMSTAEIIEEYPDLEAEDVRQALHYAAWTVANDIYSNPASSGSSPAATMRGTSSRQTGWTA